MISLWKYSIVAWYIMEITQTSKKGNKRMQDTANSNAKRQQPKAKPPTKRARQAIETRERIYSCADALFLAKGYEGTTIADIAEAAGISSGLIYYYFKNKENILRLWIAGLDEKYLDYYKNVLCSQTMTQVPALNKIRKMMETINMLFFSHGVTLNRNAYALMLRDADVGHRNTDPARGYYAIMTELVNQAIQNGEIRNEHISVGKVVKQITAISRGCKVEWMLNDCEGDLIREEDEMLVAFFKTLGKEPINHPDS